jgi:hypothetical protein
MRQNTKLRRRGCLDTVAMIFATSRMFSLPAVAPQEVGDTACACSSTQRAALAYTALCLLRVRIRFAVPRPIKTGRAAELAAT